MIMEYRVVLVESEEGFSVSCPCCAVVILKVQPWTTRLKTSSQQSANGWMRRRKRRRNFAS